MKIIIKDFGPISHFEFDLRKDLHVIFGKNNIGKSYAISAVYLILKNFISSTQSINISQF
ncbi:MAG: AAA family ATPase, partial [Flavipsychrobacter sp.]|nr:AAA family ATPase [Flavipsychrobacter sp.]